MPIPHRPSVHVAAWILLCVSAPTLLLVVPTYTANHYYMSRTVILLNTAVWPGAIVALLLAAPLFLWAALGGARAGMLGLALVILVALRM